MYAPVAVMSCHADKRFCLRFLGCIFHPLNRHRHMARDRRPEMGFSSTLALTSPVRLGEESRV
jgi:hypothetical protein